MKTNLIFICSIFINLIFHTAFGQKLPIDLNSNKVVFTQIIELDSSFKAERIYKISKEWFSSNLKNFNRSNSDNNFKTGDLLMGIQRGNSDQLDQLFKNSQPLTFQDLDEKKLIGRSVLKYTGSSLGCLRLIFLEYDVKIQIKDYKLKVDISNLNYTHFNQKSMTQSQVYGFKDSGPCSSKGTIENLLGCDHCEGELDKFYTFVSKDMNNLGSSLKIYLNENKLNSKKEEW